MVQPPEDGPKKQLSKNQQKKLHLYWKNDGALMRALANLTKRSKSSTAQMLKQSDVDAKISAVNHLIRSRIGNEGMKRLEEIVCKKLEYCKKTNSYTLLMTIVSAVIGAFEMLSGVLSALVFWFKQAWFDKHLCNC